MNIKIANLEGSTLDTSIVDLKSRWFSGDSRSAADNTWARAERDTGQDSNQITLVDSLKALLLILYWVHDHQAGEIKVIEKDRRISASNYSQVFTWRQGKKTLTFQVIISCERISNYPGIEEHLGVLRWGGFLD